MSDSMKKAYKWLENITESKYLDCDKFGTFSIDKEKLVNDFKSYMGDKIMKYTEKTSGAQIKQMLTMLKEDAFVSLRLEHDNGNIGIRVENLPSIGEIVEVLNTCGINPMFVLIDNRWEHLALWVCNHDGSEIY